MVTAPLLRKHAEQRLTMSYEAYLEWADEDTHQIEGVAEALRKQLDNL